VKSVCTGEHTEPNEGLREIVDEGGESVKELAVLDI
jgi:hypothetical protein